MARIQFDTADGVTLVGERSEPAAHNGGAAVLCHPHPDHGGSMESWLMPVLDQALVDHGWWVLRFNFRGVGESGGAHGGGEPELEDVKAAVRRTREEVPDAVLLMGGWSFGAHVSLRYAASDKAVAGWFGIGLTYRPETLVLPEIDVEALESWDTARKLFLHGSRDQFTPVERLETLVRRVAKPKELRIIDGADHLLATHGDILSEAICDFARECLDTADRS